MQFFSLATVLLLLAAVSNAVKVFRQGNASKPVTGDAAKEKDFGALKDGKFQPSNAGLSTNIDRTKLPGGGDKNVWSIDSSQLTADFGFVTDGSDVGGRNSAGHRSITIKKAFEPVALLNALNALPWVKEPNVTPKPAPGPDKPKPKPKPKPAKGKKVRSFRFHRKENVE